MRLTESSEAIRGFRRSSLDDPCVRQPNRSHAACRIANRSRTGSSVDEHPNAGRRELSVGQRRDGEVNGSAGRSIEVDQS
ncbi:MAG TPA: hypothetical protein DCQ98_04745 [Planctomycetaceae bacterium]|nr:hypothetical protein [Planctomycetaceae bacterium]